MVDDIGRSETRLKQDAFFARERVNGKCRGSTVHFQSFNLNTS